MRRRRAERVCARVSLRWLACNYYYTPPPPFPRRINSSDTHGVSVIFKADAQNVKNIRVFFYCRGVLRPEAFLVYLFHVPIQQQCNAASLYYTHIQLDTIYRLLSSFECPRKTAINIIPNQLL